MIQIDDFAARALMRFGAEILDIDSRSRCSDKYFRQHFTMLAKNPYVRDAFLALIRASESAGAADAPGAQESAPPAADTAAQEAAGQEPPSGGDEEVPAVRHRRTPET